MTALGENTAAYPIRAVERVCDILDALQDSPDGTSLSEVVEFTSLPKSSVYRYLSALEARRYVERAADGNLYRLGVAFRPSHRREVDLLLECARPHLERLRDRLSETVNLGLLDGATIVHALVVESPHMMRLAARAGEHGALHSTALGKAMSAQLPEERVRSMLAANGSSKLGKHPLDSVDGFLAGLEAVREQGYGVDDCENQPDGRCVAVPLLSMPFASGISVSAPASRLSRDEIPAVAQQLREVAKRIAKDFRLRSS
jgi:DNA-binding IclR family transcriptional regulator